MADHPIARATPGVTSGRTTRGTGGVLLPLSAVALLFFGLPLVALIWSAASSGAFGTSLSRPLVMDAVRLSLVTTGITLVLTVAGGTPLAYLLARRRFRGKWLVSAITELPLVLPPVVAGVGLLMAFGRRGLLGGTLDLVGIQLPFTLAAVVMAQLFVSAPFYVRSAVAGFEGVDRTMEEAAAIDGAAPGQVFLRVTLPLSASGLGAGAVLAWARSLSEFGATLMFAGNFGGRTQTMPLAIMSALETDLDGAVALSVLLVLGAGGLLAAARLLGRITRSGRAGGA